MKICFLLSRIPWPLDKGDKLRAYYQIKHLSKSHDIRLIALSQDSSIEEEARQELGKYCSSIHFLKLKPISQIWNMLGAFIKGKPFQIGYFFDSSHFKKVQSILHTQENDFLICQLVRMAEYARYSETRKLLDYQDALSYGLKRRKALRSGISKWVFGLEQNRMEKYENEVFDAFDSHSIITENDREWIQHQKKNTIHIIPNGIDTERFKYQYKDKKYDILFAGNMNYPPNINAVQYLAEEILPPLFKQRPHLKILIAGANPSLTVKKLANKNIEVSGWMDDITKAYAESKIFVAPMRIGTGLQNKLLEAMAMKLPCITSPIANAAIGAKKDQIIVAKNPQEYQEAIQKLLDQTEVYQSFAENAYRFVTQKYSWDSVAQQIESIMLKNA